MNQTDRAGFLSVLRTGDFGIIHGHNFFATLQNLYRMKFNEGPLEASHAFYLIDPPKIAESNGLTMTGPGHGDPTILKNIGDKTECWVFRYPEAIPQQIQIMSAAAQEAVDAGGHYDVMDIVHFGIRFIQKSLTGKASTFENGGGMDCSEFDSSFIRLAGLPYMKTPIDEITPSLMLNWMMGPEAMSLGWVLIAHYDGRGNYFTGGLK